MNGVGGSPSAEEVVHDFMAAFTEASPTGDATMLGRFFSEDAIYCNGPLEPVFGREAIVADLAMMMSLGGEVEVEVRHLLSDGEVVMTERVDYVRLGGKRAGLRIAGVFDVHDGVITRLATTSIPTSSRDSYPLTDRPGGADIERCLGIPERRDGVPLCGTFRPIDQRGLLGGLDDDSLGLCPPEDPDWRAAGQRARLSFLGQNGSRDSSPKNHVCDCRRRVSDCVPGRRRGDHRSRVFDWFCEPCGRA